MTAADNGSSTATIATDVSDVSHKDMANAIRFLAADAVQRANSGHPGMPMGMADVATVLFTRFLKYDPTKPNWPDRDRFVLSAGHGSMLLYSLLHLTGYTDMSMSELENFRQLGSKTAGHPEYGHAAGIETTTGPLGQGIATAVGMALAERMQNAHFGDGLVDHYTYVVAGDGCLMEGISHEAISMAGHLKLGKLIVLWDDNEISIDGGTDLSVSDNQQQRFQASGWETSACDGHDPEAVAAAIAAAQNSDKPSLIACRTIIGHGAPTKQGTSGTHGAPLGDDEIAAAREKMGWPHAPFQVPDDVLGAWRNAGARGSADRAAWNGRLSDDSKGGEFSRRVAGDLPNDWQAAILAYKKMVIEEGPKWATRQASGKLLDFLCEAVPEMIGGSADLTGSVNTKEKGIDPISADDFSGRYVYYGVREHGMAAAMNGMALHGGLIPYSGTFLVFADYMRGAIRLSALMGQRVVYVLTHDSIGLGEDGPTHQPVETLASLRAMPNFHVFRPCDPIETAECWELAVARNDGPSGMVLTRQGVPLLRGDAETVNKCARGGYVLAEADGDRQVTLLATGSEVSLAMVARDQLQAEGIGAAVVSMPCWELFDEQDAAYQDTVLGNGSVRVAVEAAVRLGWDRYLGLNDSFVGMDSFGASAPAGDLYKHFGITADAVTAEAKSKLK